VAKHDAIDPTHAEGGAVLSKLSLDGNAAGEAGAQVPPIPSQLFFFLLLKTRQTEMSYLKMRPIAWISWTF